MNNCRTFKYLAASLVLFLLAVFAAGCQKKVYLMPTPSVIASGEINPFARNLNLEENNQIAVFYATNRSPLGTDNFTNYSIFPGKELHMGIAHLNIGDEKTEWNQIFKLSTTDKNSSRPALSMDRLEEMVSISLDDSTKVLPKKFQVLADNINTHLEKSLLKDIMVYVHGANSTTYRASAQAAQFRHFTGRNSLVLVFMWPSAENILAYGKDVRHARKSAPAFKRLINLLSEHTIAENINILAYSAGSQIVSPGLAVLGQEVHGEKRQQLRLGEVYFAAADIGVDTFVENLHHYIDIPRSVTISINRKDSVLAISRRHHGVSRLGSPDPKDLGDEDSEWIHAASHESRLHIIGVDDRTVKGMSARAHDFWYNHPWISSDVLLQFMFHADPEERGLTENIRESGLRFWTFPEDYPDRIVRIIQEAKETRNSEQ